VCFGAAGVEPWSRAAPLHLFNREGGVGLATGLKCAGHTLHARVGARRLFPVAMCGKSLGAACPGPWGAASILPRFPLLFACGCGLPHQRSSAGPLLAPFATPATVRTRTSRWQHCGDRRGVWVGGPCATDGGSEPTVTQAPAGCSRLLLRRTPPPRSPPPAAERPVLCQRGVQGQHRGGRQGVL
jgi:hypothetical protein